MCLQIAFRRKLPAANLALVPGVKTLGSAAAALSMRRVVVSVESGVVVKHQATNLTLDTRRPCLCNTEK